MAQKVINFSIVGNNKQQNELKNIMKDPQPYPVNREINNLEQFNNEEHNLHSEKSKKIQIIFDEAKESFINNNFKEKNHKIKSKYFCTRKNKLNIFLIYNPIMK